MTDREPDLVEIRKDLGQFEKELPSPSLDSLISFSNALLRIWQDLRHANTSDNMMAEMKQLRLTYVRRFLETVPQIPPFLEEIWFRIVVFIDMMGDELKNLFHNRPELSANYERLSQMYPEREIESQIDSFKRERGNL